MHDDGPLVCPHCILVAQLEAVGQLEVQLNGGTLELSAEGVEDGDVNLGPIEGTVTLIHLHRNHELCETLEL